MPSLSSLMRLPARPLISIVGAGGKTTTMYTLAAELAALGKRVVTTTTTNIYIPRSDETDTLVVAAETPTLLRMVNAAWGISRSTSEHKFKRSPPKNFISKHHTRFSQQNTTSSQPSTRTSS